MEKWMFKLPLYIRFISRKPNFKNIESFLDIINETLLKHVYNTVSWCFIIEHVGSYLPIFSIGMLCGTYTYGEIVYYFMELFTILIIYFKGTVKINGCIIFCSGMVM